MLLGTGKMKKKKPYVGIQESKEKKKVSAR